MLSLTATLCIVGVGLVIVVGGILGFRLHAFLALVLAAIVVSLLTPNSTVEWYRLGKLQIPVLNQQEGTATLDLKASPSHQIGQQFLLAKQVEATGSVETVATATLARFDDKEHAIVDIMPVEGSTGVDWDKSIVVTPQAREDATAFANQTVGNLVAGGFGATCTGIGILIALAAIIGKCLLDSGAAEKIVRWMLSIVGEKNAPLSFIFSGFALSTPVFFDTVFYLMIPIGKAMRLRTGKNYLLYILTIVTGGTMAHSLVPPTPGPLFVAEELGVDVGVMILAGGLVGLSCAMVGFLYSIVLCRFVDIPLRESPDMSLEELQNIADREDSDLPSIWMSLMPIILPVLLITGATVMNTVLKGVDQADISPVIHWVDQFFVLFGNKNIAMAISATLAIIMLVRQKKSDVSDLANSLQAALASGGVIILITAAGGAFGKSLQQTGIANLFGDVAGASTTMILVIAFVVTALVRLAQGSATVSMITGVGVMASFAAGVELGFHPVYLALAIGCGSKMFLWMNDSGFWVIGKMSGMTEWETLKYVTPMTSVMGVFGLLVTILAANAMPLV
ncbi:GntP family permease [Rubinisphaera italica]|uniref:Gnt-II system L-idonate transporter n=1 Tax=Rubinisphaera italica TaxID=2527969 RepID=A0A5C5XNU4_9PLAN|nr:GntP family permease [Rubinisphaera italica]TWT64053.1 Gnt-II system L-idonate transporter [Rubinisphaera italica]